ncbi:ABC transporter permease [Arthrobacter sp. 35W]|uniref:ABC transporter permease n=1 Tax=Arthrobacter sp. 35W TaxID=1132441 RepID=UPI000420F22A|nr:ABC transporter permease [Arthrobacter sp. 35W]
MFLALRDIRFAKGRFALMGGVVALISLLLVLLSGLTAGLGNQSTSALANLGAPSGKLVDRIAFGAPGANDPEVSFTESQVTGAQMDAWSATDGVASASALGISQTRFQGSGDAKGTANVAVFGVAPDSSLAPAPVADGAVVISSSVAKDLGLAPGDMATVGGRELRISAVTADDWYSHTPVVWTSLQDWSALAHLSDPEQVGTAVAVVYNDGVDGTAVAAAADDAAHTTSTTRTGAFQGLGGYKSENGSLLMMQGFLYGISALVIVAFLTVWTVQRTRDIAVLKAMGASSGYLLRDALTQAALVLLAGAAAGGLVGLAGGMAAAKAAPFLISPATVLLPVAGIVLLGLAGAALAVRRVTKVDPLLALGGS